MYTESEVMNQITTTLLLLLTPFTNEQKVKVVVVVVVERERGSATLLRPSNCVNIYLGRSVQLQSLGKVDTPLHYCWILIQQRPQLFHLQTKFVKANKNHLNFFFLQYPSCLGDRRRTLTSFLPKLVKKWSSKLRLASRTWQYTTDLGMEFLKPAQTILT